MTEGGSPKGRERCYREYLAAILSEWEPLPEDGPIIISGMAGSSIGMDEVPYARTPFSISGKDYRFHRLEFEGRPMLLLSGVSTECEMMRGEETEAVGLLGEGGKKIEDCTLLLPGTHSKHVMVQSAQVVGITTYMTGELFEVLSRHSILKATVDAGGSNFLRDESFVEGVRAAEQHGMASSLFQARARSVLQGRDAAANAAYLSGVLIGGELLDAARPSEGPFLIGRGGALGELYAKGAEALWGLNSTGGNVEWRLMKNTELAVVHGHAKFIEAFA